MKHRIKQFWSLLIALSMLLSLIPFYGAAVDDEFAGFDTLEEVPFEFELEPGDLPFEQLKDAVLAAEDIPSCIDPALAEARGHVNRLYLQEPDDYTVMFQNRDASKTVYVFSYPVKGSSAGSGTAAALTVSGNRVSFSGSNAVTSRIGELHDYNIGYCEIQTLPGGILSADGVDITEDARGWARGESSVSELAYNISSEAAAEYAASIAIPEPELSTAALVPGMTITPIDPAPIGDITVMSISYSTLAGLMSFKNVTTDKFLTLTHLPPIKLTTRNGIVVAYSQWLVTYDSYLGYVVSNLSNVYNTYLGFDDIDEFRIDYLDDSLPTFTLSIESSANSIVTIDCYEYAIDYDGDLYEMNQDEDYFPDSCQWEITNKEDCTLVSSISPTSSVRIERSETLFDAEYTLNPNTPNTPTHYDIGLYDATNNTMVDYESGYDFADTGIYTMYYKDKYTRVKSENFTLVIYDIPNFNTANSPAEHTFSIRSVANPSAFLSMNVTAGATSIAVSEYNATNQLHNNFYNVYENWENHSKAFTISTTSTIMPRFQISSILTESQYTVPAQSTIGYNNYSGGEYTITDQDDKANTLDITNTSVGFITPTESYPELTILDIGEYFLIFSTSTDGDNILNNKALKYVEDEDENMSVVSADFVPSDTSYRWKIEQIGINVPLIRQTQQYICGAATFLQVLYGARIGSQVPESTTVPNKGLHSQMYYLAWSSESGETQQILPYSEEYKASVGHIVGGTSQSSFANSINSYSLFDNNATGQYHRYVIHDEDGVLQEGADILTFRGRIDYSLSQGWAPFVLTRSGGRPYKYDDGAAHYVCIIGFEEYTNAEGSLESYVIVSNCHWVGTVLGIYAIPLDEFYNKVDELFYYQLPTA